MTVCVADLDEKPRDMPVHVDADMGVMVVDEEEEEEPVPSAPPLSTPSPKLYPILPTESNVLVNSPREEEPMPTHTPISTPMASPYMCSRSDCNLQRVSAGKTEEAGTDFERLFAFAATYILFEDHYQT